MTIRFDTLARGAVALALTLPVLLGGPRALEAQTAPELSFIRALGDHHGLPATEIAVLTEWRIPTAEMPAALEIAKRAGISPDVVVASRRNGRSWPALAARYGLTVASFHVRLSDPPPVVAELYAVLADLPRARWTEASFEDAHLVFLVNLGFLQAYAGVSADEAAAALARHGSPAEALRALGS